MRRGNSIIAFHNVLIITFYAVPLFDFFKATFSTLNIYIKLIYIKSLGLYLNNETTVLQTKTIWRSLLNNLDFADLSTQAKHLRVWILHEDWLNNSLRCYC